jgi:TRAP-type C4-dicarboxylate transport system permease large subunit
MGMFMETTVITLLTTPIFLPIIKSMGVDPVYFGILMMTIVTMGSMTPPVGVSMFITQDILGCTTKEYTKESLPYIACIFGMIALFLVFPDIVTFLPNLIMG